MTRQLIISKLNFHPENIFIYLFYFLKQSVSNRHTINNNLLL